MGSKFGKTKWPNSNKTYLGTFSGYFFTMLLNTLLILVLIPGNNVNHVFLWRFY